MEKWARQSHFKCSSVRGNYKEVLKTLKRYCMSSTAIMLLIKLNVFYCWLDNSRYEQVLLHY